MESKSVNSAPLVRAVESSHQCSFSPGLVGIDKPKAPAKAFQQSLREHAETARRARLLVALRDDLVDDPALSRAFELDHDIHSVVAARIYGVSESQVDGSMRRVAKTVNFGVIYGLSPYGLAARLGIPQAEAGAFIDSYFREYAGVDQFITRTLEAALAAGRVETILGRRRPISGIKNTTGRNRNLAERTAVNTVIQGSAADLIKMAMIKIDRRLRADRLQSRMILQIHDELVFEAPEGEIADLAALVRPEMNTALALEVPLKVDLGAGINWLDVGAIEG